MKMKQKEPENRSCGTPEESEATDTQTPSDEEIWNPNLKRSTF